MGLETNAPKTKVMQSSGVLKAYLPVDVVDFKEIDSYVYLVHEVNMCHNLHLVTTR